MPYALQHQPFLRSILIKLGPSSNTFINEIKRLSRAVWRRRKTSLNFQMFHLQRARVVTASQRRQKTVRTSSVQRPRRSYDMQKLNAARSRRCESPVRTLIWCNLNSKIRNA